MKTQMTIPYFTIDAPYELAYRNNGTSSPARPHTHNALEICLQCFKRISDHHSASPCASAVQSEADHL